MWDVCICVLVMSCVPCPCPCFLEMPMLLRGNPSPLWTFITCGKQGLNRKKLAHKCTHLAMKWQYLQFGRLSSVILLYVVVPSLNESIDSYWNRTVYVLFTWVLRIWLLRWCMEGLTGYGWNIDTGIWSRSYGISDQICWSATFSHEPGTWKYLYIPELFWFWVSIIYVMWVNIYSLFSGYSRDIRVQAGTSWKPWTLQEVI